MKINWDMGYKKGLHWETGRPSKHGKLFLKYIDKKDKILEIGSGSGRDIIFLTNKGFNITGVDISKVAVNKVKEKNKYIKIKVCNVENLPFKDNSFDAVYSVFVLNFTNIKKSAKEIKRVLKREGIAYLVYILKTEYINKKSQKEGLKEKDIINNFKDFKIIEKQKYKELDKEEGNEHYHTYLKVIFKKY